MKIASLLAFTLLGAASISLARDSAYSALRLVGNQRGQGILDHVIEVTGVNGAPEPASWKIIFEDENARSGVREIEVAKGRITSERTPTRSYAGTGATMDFQKLNLDSEGLFTIIEKEARKAGIGFDSVDYALRPSDEGKAPLWTVKLLDASRRTLGTMQIAADNGALVRSDLYGRARGPGADERRPPQSREETVERTDVSTEDTGDEGPHRGVKYHIKRGMTEAGASIEEFFTGRRTLDRQYRDE